MNTKYLAALLALIVTLSGCAAPEALLSARNSSGASCCAAFSELPYQDLPLGTPRKVEIDVRSPSFSFPEGASRFVAFRLPSIDRPLSIRAKTTIVGIDMPQAFVFYPGVTFVDGDFIPSKYVNPKMTFEGGFMSSTESHGWTTEFSIPRGTRYLVFHVGSDAPGRLYYAEGVTSAPGTVVPAGKSAVFIPGNWWDVYLPTAWAGRLQVTLSESPK